MDEPPLAFQVSLGDAGPTVHRFDHDAMATTFEILIPDQDADYAQQVAWAAFDELDRLEEEMSRFIETSDISRINALGPGASTRIGIATFECLQLAVRVGGETGGAFDPTIGSQPLGGLDRLALRESDFAVSVTGPGVVVDLGGIGKGYALDRMADQLRDWSVDSALLHSGQSTVLALGTPSGLSGWPVSLRDPMSQSQTLATLLLCDRAISGSGKVVHGEHILDPRTGQPATAAEAAWALAGSAALSDALATAFMVLTADEVKAICERQPDVSGRVIKDALDTSFGFWALGDD